MTDRFDKFTERARKVLQLAQEEAQRFNHNYIGTEHILLGLVREGDGVAARVLNNLGIELHKVRSAVEPIIGRGDRMVTGEIGLTPRAKRVIELAVDEARRLNHHYIGTEHLLLGLVREGEGIAAGVLESLGLSLQKARVQVIEVLKDPTGYSAPSSKQRAGGPFDWLFNKAKEASSNKEKKSSSSFDRFTKRARKVLQLAQEEAQRLDHNYIGTEHILLGLVREGGGVAARILNELGVELYKARFQVELMVGRGEHKVTGEIGMTPRAKRVIELAMKEAQDLNHTFIGTEHLLLGLVREGGGVAVDLLKDMGLSMKKMRTQVMEMLTTLDDHALSELQESAAAYLHAGKTTTGLTERERQILVIHTLVLAGRRQYNAEEVAVAMGITEDEVRKIEMGILNMLPLAVYEGLSDASIVEEHKSMIANIAVEQLRTLFDYSIWARDQILGPIEKLDETQLRSAPESGVYGSIYSTLAHMAVSEWLWVQRCLGEAPMKLPKGEDFANLRVLIDWWNEQHSTAIDYLSSITDDDLGKEITYLAPDGKTRMRKVWHMLLQAPNHQTEHRSQLATMLGQMGMEVPPTDLVVYLSEKQF